MFLDGERFLFDIVRVQQRQGGVLKRMIGPAVEKGTGAGDGFDHGFRAEGPTDAPAGVAPVFGQPVHDHNRVLVHVFHEFRRGNHPGLAWHPAAL